MTPDEETGTEEVSTEEVVETPVEETFTKKQVEGFMLEAAQSALNMAADLAAKLPTFAGKSAAQHGTDISHKIRDMIKK